MKYIKYGFYIILALSILFIGMGIITPTISYKNEVVVDKPIKEAWAVMSDETRISEWLKVITKMELVSGTSNTVGAVYKIYVVENGEEMVMEETITSIKPYEMIAMTFTMDFMNMDYEMIFKEEDGKTHIHSISEVAGNGIFAKSILSFMTGSMEAQEEENLNNLKEAIEENTKNYFPNPDIDSSVGFEE